MTTYTLNIGLENNPLNADQITALMVNELGIETDINTSLNVGEYNGRPENTLVVNFTSDHSISEIIELTENLCTKLTQECIPVKGNNFGILIYNEDFTGERFTFDPAYFIEYSEDTDAVTIEKQGVCEVINNELLEMCENESLNTSEMLDKLIEFAQHLRVTDF